MAKTTHTNRGICQVCGSLQAVDNTTGIVAKHGYKVAGYHFFMGVCPGAKYLPAQKDVTLTNQMIADLTKSAISHDADAVAYDTLDEDGNYKLRVTTYQSYDRNLKTTKKGRHGMPYTVTGGYVALEITANTDRGTIENEQNKARLRAEMDARQCRSYVKMMQDTILPMLGTELAVGKAKPTAWAVGDVATFGGTTFTVEAIRDDICRGCGPYMNGRLMPHLVFTKKRPDGSAVEFSIPTRSARRPKL